LGSLKAVCLVQSWEYAKAGQWVDMKAVRMAEVKALLMGALIAA
jgi:hypothetical protein